MNFDVWRQDLFVELFGLGLDSFEDVLGLLPAKHQDDAFDGIVILLKAELSETRRVADGYVSDIFYADRHAFVGAHNYVSNIVGVADQADTADVIELSALRIESAAGICVVRRQGCGHLRDGQVISVNASRI